MRTRQNLAPKNPEEESKSADSIKDSVKIDTETHCKIREIALQILNKAWKAWFELSAEARNAQNWTNNVEFRGLVIRCVDEIVERFPKNANYIATGIKLQTLAVRFFVQQADSFDKTEEQMRKVSELICTSAYMD